MDQARFVLDAAIAILEVVKVTLVVGLAALEAVTKFLLTGIINIKEIGFDVRLELFSHGRLSAYIVVGFFGQPPDRYSVTIPIFNPFALVGDLAKKGYSRLRKEEEEHGRKKQSAYVSLSCVYRTIIMHRVQVDVFCMCLELYAQCVHACVCFTRCVHTHTHVCVMCAHAGAFVQLGVHSVCVHASVLECVYTCLHVPVMLECIRKELLGYINKVEILHSPSPEFHNIVPSIF